MADSDDIIVCLRPSENSPAAEVQLPAGEFVLGRTVFYIRDKYCSRRQAAIAVTKSGEVSLTPRGINPMQIKRKDDEEFSVLPPNEAVSLKNGDTFTLYHRQHPITVFISREQEVCGPSDLVPGICVWMKHPGFPYWPARIAKLSEVGPGIRAKKGKNTHLLYFFGSHDYTWVRLPNESMGRVAENDAKRRRKSAQSAIDSERDISCGCLCWPEEHEEGEEDASSSSKKRKRGSRQFVYPIHLFKCGKKKKMAGSKDRDFETAIEETLDWTQTPPEDWKFPVWVPGEDSDDEEALEELARQARGDFSGGPKKAKKKEEEEKLKKEPNDEMEDEESEPEEGGNSVKGGSSTKQGEEKNVNEERDEDKTLELKTKGSATQEDVEMTDATNGGQKAATLKKANTNQEVSDSSATPNRGVEKVKDESTNGQQETGST